MGDGDGKESRGASRNQIRNKKSWRRFALVWLVHRVLVIRYEGTSTRVQVPCTWLPRSSLSSTLIKERSRRRDGDKKVQDWDSRTGCLLLCML